MQSIGIFSGDRRPSSVWLLLTWVDLSQTGSNLNASAIFGKDLEIS